MSLRAALLVAERQGLPDYGGVTVSRARRMKARRKASDRKSARFVQSLNGSGVAIGCALIAVLENFQSRDEIPEVVWPSASQKPRRTFNL